MSLDDLLPLVRNAAPEERQTIAEKLAAAAFENTRLAMTLPPAPKLAKAYDVKQAAERLGVGEWLVRRMVRRGELASYRTGRGKLIRIEASEVEAYIATRQAGGR